MFLWKTLDAKTIYNGSFNAANQSIYILLSDMADRLIQKSSWKKPPRLISHRQAQYLQSVSVHILPRGDAFMQKLLLLLEHNRMDLIHFLPLPYGHKSPM